MSPFTRTYYQVLQVGLQLLCRISWNLVALVGVFLFALVQLRNHLGSITGGCDCCIRVSPWCTSIRELRAAIVGSFCCKCLLPVMQEGLIWIKKTQTNKLKSHKFRSYKTKLYSKSQWRYFHHVFSVFTENSTCDHIKENCLKNMYSSFSPPSSSSPVTPKKWWKLFLFVFHWFFTSEMCKWGGFFLSAHLLI